MTDQDRKEFFELLADVHAFYRKDLSQFSGSVYWEGLKPFDLAGVRDAFTRYTLFNDKGEFLPMPNKIIEMLRGSPNDAALLGWHKVDRAVRTVGTHRSVAFDDPLIHRVVSEMGGWIGFGEKSEDEWPFLRNEFVNRYRGYRSRGLIPEYPPVMIGIAEAGNSKANEDHREPPVLIGDPAIAHKVITVGTNKPLLGMHELAPAAAAKARQLVDMRSAA